MQGTFISNIIFIVDCRNGWIFCSYRFSICFSLYFNLHIFSYYVFTVGLQGNAADRFRMGDLALT